MFRTISRRGYSTFKSKNDEQNNLVLLQMLKKIPALGEKVIKQKVEKKQTENEPLASAPFNKLDKILKLFYTDPLMWDVSTLSRIYKLPEDYVKCLVENVKPFAYYASNNDREPQKLVKFPFVFDLARFKADNSYMSHIRDLKFVDSRTTLEKQSTKPVVSVDQKW